MSTCDGTRNIRAVPRRSQRHERHTKTVVTSPLRKSWPRKSNPIYTLEGLALGGHISCPEFGLDAPHDLDRLPLIQRRSSRPLTASFKVIFSKKPATLPTRLQ